MANEMNFSGVTLSQSDARDWTIETLSLTKSPPLSIQLRHDFAPRDQGKVPCCVSCALVTCMEILDRQMGVYTKLSALFHFYQASDGLPTNRFEIREGLKVAANMGICRWQSHRYPPKGTMPMTIKMARTSPSLPAIDEAKQYTLRKADYGYYNITYEYSLQTWQGLLSQGVPILLGISINAGYDNISPQHPIWSYQDDDNNDHHSVAVVGYNNKFDAFIIKDSRGTKKGGNGYWFLPYSLLEDRRVLEAWAITEINY